MSNYLMGKATSYLPQLQQKGQWREEQKANPTPFNPIPNQCKHSKESNTAGQSSLYLLVS